LDKVVYILYGTEIGSGEEGWGSLDDFAMFTAAQFEEFVSQNSGKVLPRYDDESVTEINYIHGFLTGMLDG
jgi:hypothetical protein